MNREAQPSLDETHLIEDMMAMIIFLRRRLDNLETMIDHLKDTQVATDRRLNLLESVLFRTDLSISGGVNVMRLNDSKTKLNLRSEKPTSKNRKEVRFILGNQSLDDDEELFGYKDADVLRDSILLRNTPPNTWEFMILEDEFRDLYGVEFDRIGPYIEEAPPEVIRALDARAAATIAGINATDSSSEDVLALNTWLNSLPIEGWYSN